MILLKIVGKILDKAKEKYGVPLATYDIVEAPSGHGDLSLPCFKISRRVGKSPVEVAKELSEESWPEEIEKAIAEGPYLNFFLNYSKALEEVFEEGILAFRKRTERALVEHTSANPTGPLHVGRGRNPIIGDSVARILKEYGYDVIREYYVDDMGYQVALLVWGCRKYGRPKGGDLREYAEIYQKAHLEENKEEVMKLLREYEEGKHREEFEEIVDDVMRGILEELKEIGIEFDSLAKESRYVFSGEVNSVLRMLEEKGLLHSDETGAKYIDVSEIFPEMAENLEDPKMYLTRSDGTSLYFLRDIAYHLDKSRRADCLVNVLGEDHKLEGNLIAKLMEILGGKVPRILFYSFVSLPEGRMSTRRGRVVFLRDLIEEGICRALDEVKKRRPEISEEEAKEIARKVGIGAVKFNIIKTQAEKPIKFTWEEALSLERDSAPFVMYSYVRCLGILRKGKRKPNPPFGVSREEERTLALKLLMFPMTVKEAAESLRPHLIAKYCLEVAGAFNKFYDSCPVLKEQGETLNSRLYLVQLTKEVLEKGMGMLGIEMPDKMRDRLTGGRNLGTLLSFLGFANNATLLSGLSSSRIYPILSPIFFANSLTSSYLGIFSGPKR